MRGENISVEDAMNLKTVCFGGPGNVPEPHWIHAGICFNKAEQPLSFGLKISHGSQRAFQIILQAFVLKQLFFGGQSNGKNSRGRQNIYKPRTQKGRQMQM